MAALSIGARILSGAGRLAMKKFSKEGLKKEATKKAATGATGTGVLNSTPAHAPGRQDRVTQSQESKKSQAPSSVPNFGSWGVP